MRTKARTGGVLLLLLLSLLAVAMAAAAAAAGVDVVDTIRLPTDGKAEARKPRPWDCCDAEICNRKLPPDCQCDDRVKSCSSACEKCEPAGKGLYVCRDTYAYEIGEPFAPDCNPSAAGN